MKVLSSTFNTFNRTGKYTFATVEYAGLFSYSLLKRGGSLVTCGVRKVTAPVAAAVCWPYDVIKKRKQHPARGEIRTEQIAGLEQKIDRIEQELTRKKQEEMIAGLRDQLARIEERLARMEAYGVAAKPDEQAVKKQKQLREDKRMVLKGILEETKALRNLGSSA